MNTQMKTQNKISQSSGTSPQGFNGLKPNEVYITVYEVSNLTNIVLRDAPETRRAMQYRPKEAVIKSLERSIKDNAGIWSELSKH